MAKLIRNKRGFTIVEVIIVLAIASVILLIVMLVVPTFQRNSRNYQRTHDIGLVSSSLSEFTSKYPGITPNILWTDLKAGNTRTMDIGYGSIGVVSSTFESATLSYYNVSSDPHPGADAGPDTGSEAGCGALIWPQWKDALTSPYTPDYDYRCDPNSDNNADVSLDNFLIMPGETCNSSGTGAGILTENSYAIFYVIETGSSIALKCVGA